MSSVGKAKEHEDWKRRQENERAKAKIVPKTYTDSEIKEMVLALLKKSAVVEKGVGSALGLSYVQSLRIPGIIAELEQSGKVKVSTENGDRKVRLAY